MISYVHTQLFIDLFSPAPPVISSSGTMSSFAPVKENPACRSHQGHVSSRPHLASPGEFMSSSKVSSLVNEPGTLVRIDIRYKSTILKPQTNLSFLPELTMTYRCSNQIIMHIYQCCHQSPTQSLHSWTVARNISHHCWPGGMETLGRRLSCHCHCLHVHVVPVVHVM